MLRIVVVTRVAMTAMAMRSAKNNLLRGHGIIGNPASATQTGVGSVERNTDGIGIKFGSKQQHRRCVESKRH